MATRNRKLKAQLILLAVIVAVICGILPITFAANLADVSGHWAEEQISGWAEKGLVKGYPDGTFKPDNEISRVEFMTLVNGAFGFETKAGIDYTDVPADGWAADVVAKATAAGYIKGYDDSTMRPYNPISREEVAAIIYRVKKLEQNVEAADRFTDSIDIPAWSKGMVGATAEVDIIRGYPDGTFKPKNLIKRCEALVALDRAIAIKHFVYNVAGVYGHSEGFETIKGNVTVEVGNVTLQNMIIEGDFTISKLVGNGNVTLRKVTVKGNTYIYGGGEHSVYFIDSNTGKTYVLKDDGPVRIVVSGTSSISQLTAQSNIKLEEVDLTGSGIEGIFVDRQVDGNIEISLTGVNVESLQIQSDGVTVNADNTTQVASLQVSANNVTVTTQQGTTIGTLVANGTVAVTGTGTIQNAVVNTSGVTFETQPENTEVVPDVIPPVVEPKPEEKPEPKPEPDKPTPPSPSRTRVTGVSLDKCEMVLVIGGETGKLTQTVAPSNASNKNVTWSSSNETVATVSGGVVTPVAIGTATITVTTIDGSKTAMCEVEVVEESKAEDFEFESGTGTITGYNGIGGIVAIPSKIGDVTVENIGKNAFYKYDGEKQEIIPNNITHIIIPNSVKVIGQGAFSCCSSLTSVTIPNSVTSIGEGALYNCSSLVSVTIPDSVTIIGEGAFDGCTGLTSIIFEAESQLESIGAYAFYDCESLTSIIIPKSVASIGGGVFDGCTGLKSINVDGSNTTYASVDGVLYNKGKTQLILYPQGKQGSYTILDGVTNIGAYAFYECENLMSITIPKSVTNIEEGAFEHCTSLMSITIPNSVTIIGDYAFADCTGLTSMTISNGVTSIGYGVFASCEKLTGITIPKSVTNIIVRKDMDSEGAFDDCTGLQSINVDELNTAYLSDNGVLYNKGKTELILCPQGKEGSYTILDGVTNIGAYAFCECEKLTSITIPQSVTSIGEDAFAGCIGLITVEFKEESHVATIDKNAFGGCTSLTSIAIPKSVTNIGEGAFGYCTGLTSITFQEESNLMNIGQLAFAHSGLTRITIPDTVNNISSHVFYGCKNLNSVTISNSIENIGTYMFYRCESLESVIIPESVTNIGDNAFYECSNLSTVYFYGDAPATGDWVFTGAKYGFKVYYLNGKTGFTTPTWKPSTIGEYDSAIFVDNDMATLGLVGTTVTSSAKGVSIGEFSTDQSKIHITPEGTGTAMITVKNAEDHEAVIKVTVTDEKAITVNEIIKYSAQVISNIGVAVRTALINGDKITVGQVTGSNKAYAVTVTGTGVLEKVTSPSRGEGLWFGLQLSPTDVTDITQLEYKTTIQSTFAVLTEADVTEAGVAGEIVWWINGNEAKTQDIWLKYANNADETAIKLTVNFVPYVDKTSLSTAISEAQVLKTSIPVGTEVGNAPEAAHNAFGTAINSAISVRDSIIATQTEVDDAVITLGTSKATFEQAIIKAADNLTGLAVGEGTLGNVPILLTPVFTGEVYNYTASVANTIGAVKVTPTVADGNTAIVKLGLVEKINGIVDGIQVGANTITVVVSKTNCADIIYTITLTREAQKVESITVKGTGEATSVEINNMLQMIAEVLPVYATNQEVSWSVINGTGSATISETGLLTGTGLGEVTVKAIATDGSGIEGTLVVAINPVEVKNAIIVPTTGTFDKNPGQQVDVTTAITFNSANIVTAVKNGENYLVPDADYTVIENVLTIKSSYLATQPNGQLVLDVIFNIGNPATLTITIIDTGLVAPTGDLLDTVSGINFIGVLYKKTDGNIYYSQVNMAGQGMEMLVGKGAEGRLAIDSFNRIHFAYATETGQIGYRIYDGSYWTSEELISSNYGTTCFKPDIAVDSNGKAHITYTDINEYANIMYATNTSGVFEKTCVYEGRYEYAPAGPGSTNGNYYEKGSYITVANGKYFILTHVFSFYGNDKTYSVRVASNIFALGIKDKELGSNYGTQSSADILDVCDFITRDGRLYALYRHDNVKSAELTVAGNDFIVTRSVDAEGITSAYSHDVASNDIVIGSINGTNLQVHYNGNSKVFSNIAVKGNAVSIVYFGEKFYAVYTDNADNKIKLVEIQRPITAIGAITGEAKVGSELTAGELTPMGATVTYQWQRADLADGAYTDIPGAETNKYMLIEADADKFIRVVATGTGNYTGTVTSEATAKVIPATVSSIAIKTAPTKTNYAEGEALSLVGLIVTLTKSDTSIEDVEFADFETKGITATPDNGAILTSTDIKVTLTHTASGKSVDQAITVSPVAPSIPWLTPKIAIINAVRPTALHDGTDYHIWYVEGTTIKHKFGGTPFSMASSNADQCKIGETDINTTTFGDNPFVIKEDTTYYMFISVPDGSAINVYNSSNGIDWTLMKENVLSKGVGNNWDADKIDNPMVIKDGTEYKLYYQGYCTVESVRQYKIGVATGSSINGSYTKFEQNPIIQPATPEAWDSGKVFQPWVVKDENYYYMWYAGSVGASGPQGIGFAYSADGVNWTKADSNPILKADGVVDKLPTAVPTVVKVNDNWHMWYLCGKNINYISTAEATPEVMFSFTGLESVTANTEFEFAITSKIVNNGAVDPSTAEVRFKAELKKSGAAVPNVEIKYTEGVGESFAASFTTNADGIAYFGPSDGISELGVQALLSESGVTTPFKTTLVEIGGYTLTLSLVDIKNSNTDIGEATAKAFTVASQGIPAGPEIVQALAGEGGAPETGLGINDTLMIVFDVDTNQSSASLNKTAVDAIIDWGEKSFGTDYMGCWRNAKTLVISATNVTGANFVVGDSITIKATANIKTADGLSAASTSTIVSTGDFSVYPPARVNVTPSRLKEAPENDGSLRSDIDYITLTLEYGTGNFDSSITNADVTINNLPTGLGFNIEKKGTNQLIIRFTGNAINHDSVNSVKTLTAIIKKEKVNGADSDLTTSAISLDFFDKVSIWPVITNVSDTGFYMASKLESNAVYSSAYEPIAIGNLQTSDLELKDGETLVAISGVSTTDGGKTFTVNATLEQGKTYILNITSEALKDKFNFKSNLNVVVKWAPVENEAVSATAVTIGQTLSNSQLSGTFKDSATGDLVTGDLAWYNPNTVVEETKDYTWIFTPTNTTKYRTITGTVNVTANPELITEATVNIDRAIVGGTPQTSAQVETATANPDFTVTGVTWDIMCELTGIGTFKPCVTYNVKIVLTSKNGKAFQSEPFKPIIPGAEVFCAEAGNTVATGTGVGNTVEFTIQYTTSYRLIKVAGDYCGTPSGAGDTAESPTLWTISVANGKASLGLSDIEVAEYATKNLYSDTAFSTEITGENTVALEVGNTTVYIKVTSKDGIAQYHAVTINRAAS